MRGNRGWPLNRVWCTLNIFFTFALTIVMEVIRENQDRRVFELSLVNHEFQTLIVLSKTKFPNSEWAF